jgi:hypothetical protein
MDDAGACRSYWLKIVALWLSSCVCLDQASTFRLRLKASTLCYGMKRIYCRIEGNSILQTTVLTPNSPGKGLEPPSSRGKPGFATDCTPLRRSTSKKHQLQSRPFIAPAGRWGVVFIERINVVSLAGVTCWCVVKGDVIGRYAEGVSPSRPVPSPSKLRRATKA